MNTTVILVIVAVLLIGLLAWSFQRKSGSPSGPTIRSCDNYLGAKVLVDLGDDDIQEQGQFSSDGLKYTDKRNFRGEKDLVVTKLTSSTPTVSLTEANKIELDGPNNTKIYIYVSALVNCSGKIASFASPTLLLSGLGVLTSKGTDVFVSANGQEKKMSDNSFGFLESQSPGDFEIIYEDAPPQCSNVADKEIYVLDGERKVSLGFINASGNMYRTQFSLQHIVSTSTKAEFRAADKIQNEKYEVYIFNCSGKAITPKGTATLTKVLKNPTFGSNAITFVQEIDDMQQLPNNALGRLESTSAGLVEFTFA